MSDKTKQTAKVRDYKNAPRRLMTMEVTVRWTLELGAPNYYCRSDYVPPTWETWAPQKHIHGRWRGTEQYAVDKLVAYLWRREGITGPWKSEILTPMAHTTPSLKSKWRVWEVAA